MNGAGASVLQGIKIAALHQDLPAGERRFYHTSNGWVVWNIMLGALAISAQLVLYEGPAVYPLFRARGAEPGLCG